MLWFQKFNVSDTFTGLFYVVAQTNVDGVPQRLFILYFLISESLQKMVWSTEKAPKHRKQARARIVMKQALELAARRISLDDATYLALTTCIKKR